MSAGDVTPLSSHKRKANLLDYFHSPNPLSVKSPRLNVGISKTRSSFDDNASIPGLLIVRSFVSEQEEKEIVEFLDAQPWRTDLCRHVIHYGGTYCLMPPRDASPEQKRKIETTILTAAPIPPEVDFIVSRMVEHKFFSAAERPEFCIVNSYVSNQGISAHVENFRFASPVCGLTLLEGDWMRFHELVKPDDGSVRSGQAAKAERTGRRVDVWMPRRSLLVMSGEVRDKWQHEIVRGRKDRVGSAWRRVSLTFRTTARK